ncbi:sigma-54 interaction domain-containing protein [Abyssisolibacter fermentans]|uniref:sigma-54 interaction domain-containing protein n=1 Tax=Abyssisolibacter fermentans TaxID=1766203 RepID=UPI0008324818|nr:sigma 54-interacting transcriptional regulator [Abyssisolibacter fermentans]
MDYKYLLESILEYLDEGVLVVNTEADVTFYNEPTTDIAGIEPKDAVGKNILDIFPDLTPETSTFYYVLKNKRPLINYVQTYMNYRGEQVSTVTSTIPLYENGEICGALEIYKSLNDMKNLSEKVLLLREELFKKNKLKNYIGNGTKYTLDDIYGQNSTIQNLKAKVKKIADSSSPVLIYGETGTGKELFVQGMHNASLTRKHKPFIAQNCAAIPRDLLESLIFGTSLGSFTGAKDKPGLFELADGGTLFLDEISSMDMELQAKLLRVLQDGVVRRVGGAKTITVDVRVVAATNQDPLIAVKDKTLREDLFYRLNVISLKLPPLRERKDDIELLTNKFIKLYNKTLHKNVKHVTNDCIKCLVKYNWPGNIRELKYTIESIMNFTDKTQIDVEDLPMHIINLNHVQKNDDKDNMPLLKDAMNQYEKELIEKAIHRAKGNYSRAARMLGVPRQTLYNKINKHGIDV